MKIKLLWIILFIGLFGANSFATEVPKTVAEKVAKNFYYQHVNQTKSVDFQSIELSLKSIHQKNAQQTFYAFDVNKNDGFVLVSAQNSVKPVLAYAFKGSFNSDNMHPGQAEMLAWYEDQIAYAGETRLPATNEIEKQWHDLINYKPENGIKSYRNVEPLLLVEWNQSAPYNAMCPEDAAAPGGHVPVGCVATAMLQVMKHYNYPETGTGSYTHYNFTNGGYGNITVNFANQTYDWEGMPLSANGYNEELAKVNFHAGVAVRMYWGATGSGTSTSRVPDALVDYFRYDHSCQLLSKDYYGDVEYKNILKGQLDNGLPMVYSGSPSSGSGHAWNCDGYIDDEFHMNWGWGGAGNGYYTLDNLVSSATPGGDDYNFIYSQDAVINIYPEANYPEHCSGSKTIVAHQGAFGDGSSNEDYNNNIDCEYLIAPECGNLIRLEFDRFDLGEGDVLTLYDGSTSSGTQIATFDTDNTPGSSTINSNTGNLLLHFQTDGSNTGKGWDVSFNTDYCGSSSSFTAQSGTISDGSGTCDYKKSTVCFWHIEPDGAEAVQLDFTEFDLADGMDYVNVYANSTSDLIETFDSENIPESITVNAPKAVVLFYANSDDNVAGGWTADYSATESDIESINILHGVNIYPNPASNDVNLAFSLSQPETVHIKIYDMLGKTLVETNLDAPVGYQKVKISQFVDFSESGLYFVDIEANEQTITRKISIVK